MVRLSVADQYLCPLKLDPSWMESGGLLWNICSYKRIKDGITGGKPMLTNSKIALSLALVLATASAAMAAPKHPVRPNTAAIQQQVSAGSHLSLNSGNSPVSVRSAGSVDKPSNISPQGYERLKRLMESFQDIGLKEDLGS